MTPSTNLFNNPLGLMLVVFLLAVVIGTILTLVSLLSGKHRPSNDEGATWSKAFRGGFDAHQRQMTDLADLHRRVTELEKPKPE